MRTGIVHVFGLMNGTPPPIAWRKKREPVGSPHTTFNCVAT